MTTEANTVLSEDLLLKIEAAANDGFSVSPGLGLALCATVKAQNAEVRAVLDELGGDAVRVHENGGPENIYASLAVSVRRLCNVIDDYRDDLEERTEQRDVFRERLDTEVKEHGDTQSRLSEVERENASLKNLLELADFAAEKFKEQAQQAIAEVEGERDRFAALADERYDQLWEARRQRDDLAARCAPYLENLK